MDEYLFELVAMADMYAYTCTRQEEKFWNRGCAWRWVDCKAAYDLIRERPDWYDLLEAFKKTGRRIG